MVGRYQIGGQYLVGRCQIGGQYLVGRSQIGGQYLVGRCQIGGQYLVGRNQIIGINLNRSGQCGCGNRIGGNESNGHVGNSNIVGYTNFKGSTG